MKGRFEIEEIVTQDKGGVVFRALDRVTGQGVALRRLLPRGRDGAGLNPREADEYLAAAERLATVRDAGLRAIVGWGVDKVDGMPWLASEWAKGESLASVMRRGKLSFEAGWMLIEQGLTVQVQLDAQAPGWRLSTDPDSVVVESEGENFRFTWWVEPFPGPEGRTRGVAGEVAGLLEAALGWRGIVPSPGAGKGLAEWIRRVRSERLTAAGALSAMAVITGPAVEESVASDSVAGGGLEVPLRPAVTTRGMARVVQVSSVGIGKRKRQVLLGLGLAFLVTCAVAAGLLLRDGGKSWSAFWDRIVIGWSGPPESASGQLRTKFRSDEVRAIGRLEGRTVTVTGVLKKVVESNEPGNPRYLVFDVADDGDHVRGRFWEGEEVAGLNKKDLVKNKNKSVSITGDVRIEEGSGRAVVHVNRPSQVRVVE